MNEKPVLPIFYVCSKCGKVIELIHDTDSPIFCCGLEMDKLPNGLTDEEMHLLLPSCYCKKSKKWLLCIPTLMLIVGGLILFTRKK